jgi:hydrogenase nickel incorporation protein HypA/HybF
MHEASLARELVSLIEEVAAQHSVTSVNRATVEIGELSTVVPEALEFAFEVARQDSVAAECALDFTFVPLVVHCSSCGYRGHAERGATGCPRCDSIPLEIQQGRDMRLVSIDVEDDEDA